MGVDLEVKRGVIIVLFLLGLSLVQVQTQPGTQVASSRDQVRHSQIIDPFVIENNTDFQIQGWPGNGTESDPYLLEDLVIRGVNSFYGYYCLYIWNSDAYFIIQNCTFVNPGSSFGNVIRFTNVTNGVIRNCTIIIERFGDEYRGDGIDLYSSSNILVTDCNITGGETGIELWQSTNCTISSSVLKNQMYYGIGTTFSNYTEIHNNTLMGAEFTNSRKGIGVGYLSTNFSVHDNNITNFLSAGIMLHAAVNISVFDNYVTESGTGISIGFSNQSKLISNILVKNDDGIGLAISTFNNVISSNILRNDVNNAIDHGFDNIWTSNWYSDYGGSGVYHISGEAENRDISPQPTTPHIPNLMNNIIILSLISLIPLGAAIGYHMETQFAARRLASPHSSSLGAFSLIARRYASTCLRYSGETFALRDS